MEKLSKKFDADEVAQCFEEKGWAPIVLRTYPFLEKMKSCSQDPKYHSEGDVWKHTVLVVDAMVRSCRGHYTSQDVKCILYLAALFHDVGKVHTTKTEKGQITSKGHAHYGARMVRGILSDFSDYHTDVPLFIREEVANLVMLHMLPCTFLNKEDPLYFIIKSSMLVNNRFLTSLARADSCGRRCKDVDDYEQALELIDLFEDFCCENNCFRNEKKFQSEHGKFKYLVNHEGHPDYNVFDGHYKGSVIMLSGLPGSGKDHYYKECYSHLDMVSLDDIRKELGTGPCENQGQVSQLAKERCREQMRQGNNFVFNATNINLSTRSRWIRLFKEYDYWVRIDYLEPNFKTILSQNKNREDTVPEFVIKNMFRKLDVPSIIECDAFNMPRYGVSLDI